MAHGNIDHQPARKLWNTRNRGAFVLFLDVSFPIVAHIHLVQSATIFPGSRQGAAMDLDSTRNRLYVFAGNGYGSGLTFDQSTLCFTVFTVCITVSQGSLNDAFAFDTLGGQWTWVFGSTSVGQLAMSNAGAKGVPVCLCFEFTDQAITLWHVQSIYNRPTARNSFQMTYDKINDHLWIFAGQNYSGSKSAWARFSRLAPACVCQRA